MSGEVISIETKKTLREFMNVREVAELLNVSTRTVYAWVEQNKIPFQRKGGSLRFRRSEIEEWDTDDKAA
jgi:excisionase family DNA binding protein